MDALFAILALFAMVGTVGSLIGLIICWIRGKKKKPFVLGLAINLIAMIAFSMTVDESQEKKQANQPQTQIESSTSNKVVKEESKAKIDKDDDYDDDDDDDKYDRDEHNEDDDRYKENNKMHDKQMMNSKNATSGPNGETIKGNINAKGEKIYHMPGSKYYDKTKPEAWFFTEQDAINAGYRAAKK